jgi:adenylate kinase family enzyme
VHVVGTSGSGKTTLARRIAARLGLPHTELDAIRHQANWTELPDDDFVSVAREIAAGDAWVVDGNYSVVRSVLWDRATHIVWPDLPKSVVMRQVFWRSLSRAVTKKPMWNGNKEHFREWVRADHPIRWAWSTYERRQREYAIAAKADPRWVRLRSHREIDDWLESLDA